METEQYDITKLSTDDKLHVLFFMQKHALALLEALYEGQAEVLKSTNPRKADEIIKKIESFKQEQLHLIENMLGGGSAG